MCYDVLQNERTIFIPNGVETSRSVERRQIHGVFHEVDVVTGLSECLPSGNRGADSPHRPQSTEHHHRWNVEVDDHLP